MTSKILEVFKQAMEYAETQQAELEALEALENDLPEVETIFSDQSEPVDDTIINAGLVYSILNGETDSPQFTFELADFSTESLECLAKLIAPMCHPNFFYLVVAKVQHDFMAAGREIDYNYFKQELEKEKAEFESRMGDPHISPLDLSRRGNNE